MFTKCSYRTNIYKKKNRSQGSTCVINSKIKYFIYQPRKNSLEVNLNVNSDTLRLYLYAQVIKSEWGQDN